MFDDIPLETSGYGFSNSIQGIFILFTFFILFIYLF